MRAQTQITAWELCEEAVSEVLGLAAGYSAEQKAALYELVAKELHVPAVEDLQYAGSPARKLGRAAKAVRLAGELPYYLAKVLALSLTGTEARGILPPKTVKDACGLEREAELIRMVVEAAAKLPDLELDGKGYDRAQLMKQAYRQGDYYEKVYRGCAQCCMAAVSDVTGRENLEMFRAANGLAAGIGLLGDGVCGGYSGGVLSMGLFVGRRKEFFDGDKAEKDLSAKLVKKLHDRFIETYGSVTCHDIHREIFGRAFHITMPDDKEAFEAAGAHKLDKCPVVVGTAAAWTAEILFDEGLIVR